MQIDLTSLIKRDIIRIIINEGGPFISFILTPRCLLPLKRNRAGKLEEQKEEKDRN